MYEPGAAKVEKIMNDPLGGGAAEAYDALKKDYDQYARSHSEAEAMSYWHRVTDELNGAGLLPSLSVAWAAHEKSRIDTNGDGMINRTEVRQQQVDPIDNVFANQLLAQRDKRDFFDSVARQSHGSGAGRNNIDQDDLDAYLARQHKQAERIRKEDNAREAMSPLLDGDSALMPILDRNGNGRVSRHEMKVFMRDYKDHQGEGVYTPENAEYVQKLLEHNVSEIDRGPFGPGFSTNKLARKGGFDKYPVYSTDDYGNVINSYDQKNMERSAQSQVFTREQEETSTHEQNQTETQEKKDGAHRAGKDDAGCVMEPPPPGTFQEMVHQMCTVRPGEGYWQTSARLLGIDIGPHGLNSSHEQNASIWRLTKQLVDVNGAAFDADNKVHPVLHPGDVIAVEPKIDELMRRNPELAASLTAMNKRFNAEHKATSADDADDAEGQDHVTTSKSQKSDASQTWDDYSDSDADAQASVKQQKNDASNTSSDDEGDAEEQSSTGGYDKKQNPQNYDGQDDEECYKGYKDETNWKK